MAINADTLERLLRRNDWARTAEYIAANAGGGVGGAVTSVFTRTGDVVATSGDYTVAQITGAASTAYADADTAVETARAEAAEALLAPKASPALTGAPTAPTQTALSNNTDIATTAYTDLAVGVETARAEAAEVLLAPISSIPAAASTVTGPDVFGASAVVGSSTSYARQDHNHGLPFEDLNTEALVILLGQVVMALRLLGVDPAEIEPGLDESLMIAN